MQGRSKQRRKKRRGTARFASTGSAAISGLTHPPKKSLGQHFLVDQNVLRQIVAAAELRPDTTVVEVGPGLGILTKELLEEAGRVIAVEIDEELCRHLMARFGNHQNFRLICQDVLAVPPREILRQGHAEPPYVMVGNLPYYITAPLLRHFLESDTPPDRMVVMVQWEVAQNLVAKPGAMSLLSVAVQFYAEPRLVVRVPPEAFYPPPEVESAVVRLDVRPHPAVDIQGDVEGFFAVVRAGFRAPRKQLRNALPQGIWMEKGEAPLLLAEAGIDPTRRAQTLTLEEWGRLWRAYRRRHPLRREGAA